MAPSLSLHRLYLLLLHFILLSSPSQQQPTSSCQPTCGSLPLQYPLGSGYGCGSPRFHPYISCSPLPDHKDNSDDKYQLLFTTHTGSYPITSISYQTSTLTISPPLMSSCSSMQPSPNFGLDWPSPFQLGSSSFILLACPPPTSSFTFKGAPICDLTYSHLCASLHSCPAIASLGLPLFSSTNTCCVYSPANLNAKGDLDLEALKCTSYTSVVSLGDLPTDPNRWEYGVELKYIEAGFDNSVVAASCMACEKSQGICGYAPPRNSFVCVCKNGINSTYDCSDADHRVAAPFWGSESSSSDHRHCCYAAFFVLICLLVLFV